MCIIGNPPYAVSSTNKGEWIQNLLTDYKRGLNERKINLDDDYIKFIRYGQHYVEKNGTGILAYISNNSFIDGITHRQMRKNILETFDKVYILDLHGNSNKGETAPDGSIDKNVFDIKQGVSINIFVKTGLKKNKELGKIYHSELYGKRDFKYSELLTKSISSVSWIYLENIKPHYFFVPKDFKEIEDYNKGIKIQDLFSQNGTGVQTDRDKLFTDFDKTNLENRISILLSDNMDEDFINTYNVKNSSSFKLISKLTDKSLDKNFIKQYNYKPFDNRNIYYDRYLVSRAGYKCNRNALKDNYIFLTTSKNRQLSLGYFFISKVLTDRHFLDSAADSMSVFPLYLYPEESNQQIIKDTTERIPNLNLELVKDITKKLVLTFTNEKEETKGTFAPIDILDYIYAVLHSPTYREKYKEFLKIDFPRVPYPKDEKTFWELVKLGKEVREIHLLDSPKVEDYITSYPKDGNNTITTKIAKKDWELIDEQNQLGRIWINEEQYFDNVPVIAWEFYIGGYQPAQKWLKDRKGRELKVEDILHYQKIIVALSETNRIMQEIDKIEIEAIN
jgi:predicted helicase